MMCTTTNNRQHFTISINSSNIIPELRSLMSLVEGVTAAVVRGLMLSVLLSSLSSMKASLEKRMETVEESEIEVFGIQRVMKPTSNDLVEWHSYYSAEGLKCCCCCFAALLSSSLLVSCTLISCLSLDPGGGSQKATVVVLVVGISSVRVQKSLRLS